jgi:hypothetical protein
MTKFNKKSYGFYSMYNWMFAYMDREFGRDLLEEYWEHIGREYYSNLIDEIKNKGIVALEDYYKDALEGEETSGEVEVIGNKDMFKIRIKNCKAIEWLKKLEKDKDAMYHMPYFKDYCDHCRVINETIAKNSGLKFVIDYDKQGSCTQIYRKDK